MCLERQLVPGVIMRQGVLSTNYKTPDPSWKTSISLWTRIGLKSNWCSSHPQSNHVREILRIIYNFLPVADVFHISCSRRSLSNLMKDTVMTHDPVCDVENFLHCIGWFNRQNPLHCMHHVFIYQYQVSPSKNCQQ